jgi:hypothetical protein
MRQPGLSSSISFMPPNVQAERVGTEPARSSLLLGALVTDDIEPLLL